MKRIWLRKKERNKEKIKSKSRLYWVKNIMDKDLMCQKKLISLILRSVKVIRKNWNWLIFLILLTLLYWASCLKILKNIFRYFINQLVEYQQESMSQSKFYSFLNNESISILIFLSNVKLERFIFLSNVHIKGLRSSWILMNFILIV